MPPLSLWSPRAKVLTKYAREGWKFYLRKLDEKPIITTTISTAGLFTAGDIFAQNLVEKRYTHAPWDYKRTLRVGAVGLLFMGPSYAVWYRGLDKLIVGSGVKQTLAKVALDQGIMAWVFCAWFVVANSVLSGRSLKVSWGEWVKHWRDIMEANYKLWPAAQLLNFSFVPSAHRVLFVNVVSVGWNTFLAWSAHRTHRHDASDSSPSNSHTKVPPQLFACAHSSLPRTSTEPPTQNIQSHHTQSPTKTAQQLPCIICKAATKEP